MNIVLLLLCVIAFLIGGSIFAEAKSAIHEIEGFMLWLISALFLVGAFLVTAIGRLQTFMERAERGEIQAARELASRNPRSFKSADSNKVAVAGAVVLAVAAVAYFLYAYFGQR